MNTLNQTDNLVAARDAQEQETQRANWLLLLLGGGFLLSLIIYVILHWVITTGATTERGFWQAGVWLWVEVIFWGWFGTLLYLLSELHQYYPESNPDRRFRDKTPWYFSTAVRGPFIALLLLLFLYTVRIDAFGISLAVSELPIEGLIFLAAVLGYFSRVARAQLEIIVSKVFSQAWNRSLPQDKVMHIEPAIKTLTLGQQHQFVVAPDQDVTWELEPARRGTIVNGLYTAPEQSNLAGSRVFVIATAATDVTRVATLMFTLQPTEAEAGTFSIQPSSGQVKAGGQIDFHVEPQTEVIWSIEPLLGTIEPSGHYVAPDNGFSAGEHLAVKAVAVNDSQNIAVAEVILTA